MYAYVNCINKAGLCGFFLQRELQLKPSVGCVNCTSYNHNGNLLVTGGMDGMIRIFGKSLHDNIKFLIPIFSPPNVR